MASVKILFLSNFDGFQLKCCGIRLLFRHHARHLFVICTALRMTAHETLIYYNRIATLSNLKLLKLLRKKFKEAAAKESAEGTNNNI